MLQERIHERVVEETVLLRVPQTKKDIVDVLVPHIKEGTLEEVSVPQFQEHTLEVVKCMPQERVQQRDMEQTVDVQLLQFVEERMEVFRHSSRDTSWNVTWSTVLRCQCPRF